MTHKTTLQGVVYQLDIALQSPDTQRNGIIFIYDMSGSKYSNFDYELSQKILTMLKVSAELIHYGYGWEEKQIALNHNLDKKAVTAEIPLTTRYARREASRPPLMWVCAHINAGGRMKKTDSNK